MFLARNIENRIHNSLKHTPVVAVLGPRQCGKSTLAKHLLFDNYDPSSLASVIYLDLERPSDLAKLTDPEAFFNANADQLICLDEIQRRPDLFPVMRAQVDAMDRNGAFLITGSASPLLLRQGSETLAGRISFHELAPFNFSEVSDSIARKRILMRGGFPRSLLAPSDEVSFEWRLNFIRTYLERDLGQFGLNIPVQLVQRLWMMLAHLHGQLINYSLLSNSLGVSSPTAKKYTDLLVDTFMVRILEPYHSNLKKRLTKTPKVYIRDSGILISLLGIESYNGLLGHPVYGSLWEGLVIENLMHEYPDYKYAFYRSSHGAEIDLVMQTPRGPIAIECKASTAPNATKGFYIASTDINAQLQLIVAPVESSWPVSNGVEVHNVLSACNRINSFLQ